MILEKILKPLGDFPRRLLFPAIAATLMAFTPRVQAQPPGVPMELRGIIQPPHNFGVGDNLFAFRKPDGFFLKVTKLEYCNSVSDYCYIFQIPTDLAGTPQQEGARPGDTLYFTAKTWTDECYNLNPTDSTGNNISVIHEPGQIKRVDFVVGGPYGIFEEQNPQAAGVFELYQNYPNPFNSGTMIKYHLPFPGIVSLEVYDILGRKVKCLVEENQNPGEHEIPFIGEGLSSGMYFGRLTANGESQTRKMTLLK